MKAKIISDKTFEKLIWVKSQIPAHFNFSDRRDYAYNRIIEVFGDKSVAADHVARVLAHHCAIATAPITEDVQNQHITDWFSDLGI